MPAMTFLTVKTKAIPGTDRPAAGQLQSGTDIIMKQSAEQEGSINTFVTASPLPAPAELHLNSASDAVSFYTT